ncbi:solute carrier family 41 member 1 [Trichonephila inaurata madagascariensis]|uniref:Solute carrier family 41 member 1 n=1 Tax=Trichonephila inaurata madagascariensis TaxID=2747483 RepID=A0A8X6XUJ5_9ARAC|nr:solute carrier family 41 member 1 [Trichonephila inaurata madagascariensis]
MAGEIIDVHGKDCQEKRCAVVRQFSAPEGHGKTVPLPVTAPGNLQCPLEFWIHSETTPLLSAVSKGPLPPKGDYVIPGCNFPKKEDPIKVQDVSDDKEETSCSIACQVFVPFMIAGFGTVAAGLLLDIVQNWNVFQEVPEMFVLVPALLGLKGNLEMTLASRISTLANLGSIDTPREQWRMAFGNVCLLQCQSLVLGLIASVFASVVGWIREGELNVHNILLLSSSSLVTASAASFLLGTITIFVVVFSRKININPDNIAAPIAASLGDVVTLALLSFISRFIFARSGQYIWVEAAVLIALLCVGGNLVAVQACRISTYLHQKALPGLLQPGELCVSPFVAWMGKSAHSRTCRILIAIAVPGHLIFITCVHFLKSTYTPLTAEFLIFYLIAALLQVALLLYMAHCFVHWLWKWGFDPDDAAIPYLTAFGDLIGTGFLLVAFLAMDAVALSS